jgi:hypothetical protein
MGLSLNAGIVGKKVTVEVGAVQGSKEWGSTLMTKGSEEWVATLVTKGT